MPPLVFGMSRSEVIVLLGTPSSWVSKDDLLFQPPKGDFRKSSSMSYGSLILSFDAADTIKSIYLNLAFECSYPEGAAFFPDFTTSIYDIAILMRDQKIPYKDASPKHDYSELITSSGVSIMMGHGRGERYASVWLCTSERHLPRV